MVQDISYTKHHARCHLLHYHWTISGHENAHAFILPGSSKVIEGAFEGYHFSKSPTLFFSFRSHPKSSFPFFRIRCSCLFCCFLPIYSGRQVRRMDQPGSHRRKVTQDFSSSFFLLWCMPLFFSREGFSRCFPSSTAKLNFVY